LCRTAASAEHDGPTLEDKLSKSDPEFLQFLKDEGSSDMLGWAADDLSDSSDEAHDQLSVQQSSAEVNMFIELIVYKCDFLHHKLVYHTTRYIYYPHMPIGKVWIYRLLFVCVFVYTVTHFSAEDKASSITFFTAVY